MGHEELKEIGINAYGHRHKLIKGIERLLGGQQGQDTSERVHDCSQSSQLSEHHQPELTFYQMMVKVMFNL